MPTLTQADIKAIVDTILEDALEAERWKKKILAEREAYEQALSSRSQKSASILHPVDGRKIVQVTK